MGLPPAMRTTIQLQTGWMVWLRGTLWFFHVLLKEFGGIDSFQDKIALFKRLIKRKIDPTLDKGSRPDTLDLP
jgi:hypothetical protein